MIEDHDPEDAYDRADHPRLLVAVLERMVDDLRRGDDGRLDARRDDALRLVRQLRRRRGVDHARLRAVRLALEGL